MTDQVPTRLVRYRFVPEESTIRAKVFSGGLLASFGHDPIVVAKAFEGEVEFVPGTFEQGAVNTTIDARSLVVANVKEQDRFEIEQTTREKVLEIGSYPQITFKSINVSASSVGDGRYRMRTIGDLGLHGVVQTNVLIIAEMKFEDDTLRVQGKFTIRQTDFKIKPISVAGGMLKVKNEVQCLFNVVAHRILGVRGLVTAL